MVPHEALTHWGSVAPWAQDAQVELDIVLSRALVEIFQEPTLPRGVLLRGAAALNKLYMPTPARCTDGIDLVLMAGVDIDEALGPIRERLDGYLPARRRRTAGPREASRHPGFLPAPERENKQHSVVLSYRFASESQPARNLRLKVEINVADRFAIFGPRLVPFRVSSPWFDGEADIGTFSLEELLATKLRALYQRLKGRDLFDLSLYLRRGGVDAARVVEAFREYMRRETKTANGPDIHFGGGVSTPVGPARGARPLTGAKFAANLEGKRHASTFQDDLEGLLPLGAVYDAEAAASLVTKELISRLGEGEP